MTVSNAISLGPLVLLSLLAACNTPPAGVDAGDAQQTGGDASDVTNPPTDTVGMDIVRVDTVGMDIVGMDIVGVDTVRTDVPGGTDVQTATDTVVGDVQTPSDVPARDVQVPPGSAPVISGCRIFPDDNPWNTDVSTAALHANNAAFIAAMNPTRALHPDWGNWSTDHYGIPWAAGPTAPTIPTTWTVSWGPTESDPLPCTFSGRSEPFCYPVPATANIEGGPGASSGSDRHVLWLDTSGAPDNCRLYELYNAQNFTGPGWVAANGAIFPLGTNALRPEGWTSADAAGLPILPGLVRVDEVLAGEIKHAIRFTMARTARGYIHPATHAAGTTGSNLPPMGLRVRLRSGFAESGTLSAEARVIIRAMKRYGMILADNGSDWFFTGDSDDRWDAIMDGILSAMGTIHGSDFEVVDTGAILPQ